MQRSEEILFTALLFPVAPPSEKYRSLFSGYRRSLLSSQTEDSPATGLDSGFSLGGDLMVLSWTSGSPC